MSVSFSSLAMPNNSSAQRYPASQPCCPLHGPASVFRWRFSPCYFPADSERGRAHPSCAFLNVYICLSLPDAEVVHRPGAYRPTQRMKRLTAGAQFIAADWTGVYHTGSRPISLNAKWHAAEDCLSLSLALFFRNIGYSGAELSTVAIELILYARLY